MAGHYPWCGITLYLCSNDGVFEPRAFLGREVATETMHVRDAVESDAAALAALAHAPRDVMRNLVHDRTVRVATRETDPGPHEDADDGDATDLLGFVSFDAHTRTVHVTQLAGTREACERLLAEPVRFAANEGMEVELLVPEGHEKARDAAAAVGFEQVGSGPRFEGDGTVRYRISP
jgi:hypothetical protein